MWKNKSKAFKYNFVGEKKNWKNFKMVSLHGKNPFEALNFVHIKKNTKLAFFLFREHLFQINLLFLHHTKAKFACRIFCFLFIYIFLLKKFCSFRSLNTLPIINIFFFYGFIPFIGFFEIFHWLINTKICY